jgi:hypothetical protein
VTWWVKSESDKITPAMNAPIAKDNPKACVRYAVPRRRRRFPNVNAYLILRCAS